MTADQHCLCLGSLVTNFHSLEFVIRVFLNRLPTAAPIGLPFGTDIRTLPVGTELDVSDITDYRTLGALIGCYNKEASLRSLGEPIDETLVTIRDAIAHGRVSYKDEMPMSLLKFSKPANGKVKIDFNQILDEAWFKQQRRRVHDAIRKVEATYNILVNPPS